MVNTSINKSSHRLNSRIKSSKIAPGSLLIVDSSKGVVVCSAGSLANTFRTRLFGLLGRKGLQSGSGLLIKPSSGVHTFGMSFPIDIVSLDRDQRVLQVAHSIGAWEIKGLSFKTASVLELPAGRIKECGIEPGDKLVIDVSPDPDLQAAAC